MLIRDYMTSPAITVRSDIPFQDALKLMRERKIRRLPVVNDSDQLVGIVSERDLLNASPSPATSLSVWELNYLLAKLTVGELMTHQVILIRPENTLDDAAMLMLDHKIGGLPVLNEDNDVVGVITESDIFKAYINRHRSREDMDVFMVTA